MGKRREILLLEPNLVDLAHPPGNGNGNGNGHGRIQGRVLLGYRGGYTGARTDRAGLKDWLPPLDSADSATVPDLPPLRARSRDAVRNQPLAAATIGVTVANVVGAGLYPVPEPDAEYLGLTQKEAAAWAATAMRLWWAHAGTSAIDITGQHHHGVQQRQALRAPLESGDVFVIRRYVEDPTRIFGLALQFVEADRVSTPTKERTNPRIVDGVEIDADGRPVAVHVSDTHPGDYAMGRSTPSSWTRVPVYGAETGSRNLIHLFDPLRPGQTRGVPILAAALERLKQMDRAVHAELMAQVVSGMIVYSVETEEGAGGEVPFQTGSQTDAERAIDEALGQFRPDYGQVLAPPAGTTVKMHAPSRPGATFEPFQLHVAREVGASVGVPAGVLLHWFSKAYSASRGEWMLAWKHWAVRRDVIAYDFSGTVYGWLIEEAVARGYLQAPGFFSDPLARAAWLGCEWRGAPPGQLDPAREIAAIKERRNLRISTLAQDTAEITGGDWRANLRQLAIEQAAAKALGVDLGLEVSAERIATEKSGAQPGQPAVPSDQDEDEDDEEEDEE